MLVSIHFGVDLKEIDERNTLSRRSKDLLLRPQVTDLQFDRSVRDRILITVGSGARSRALVLPGLPAVDGLLLTQYFSFLGYAPEAG